MRGFVPGSSLNQVRLTRTQYMDSRDKPGYDVVLGRATQSVTLMTSARRSDAKEEEFTDAG